MMMNCFSPVRTPVRPALTLGFCFALAVGAGLGGCGSPAPGTLPDGGSGGGGGSTGTGGSGSGGASATDTGGDRAPGTGGAPMIVDAGDGGAADRPGDGPDSGLHGGASGRFICPAGVSYAGLTPAMTGAATTASGPALPANVEGPVWVGPLRSLLFTSKDNNGVDVRQIWKLTPPSLAWTSIKTVVGTNGMTLDPDDKLISADHQMSAIVRLEPSTGAVIEVVAATYQGNHFRAPNDVVVRGDGNIYFSDPEYAVAQGPVPKIATTAFYRISPPPARQVSIIEDTGHKDPNGVALSPDDNTLYTMVTADRAIKKWAVNADGSLGASAILIAQTGPVPDGICMDCAGNLYVGTQSGLEIYSPAGAKLTTLLGMQAVNCSFGGLDHQTLFVTASGQVMILPMNLPGLP
jgi:gluconolactonase